MRHTLFRGSFDWALADLGKHSGRQAPMKIMKSRERLSARNRAHAQATLSVRFTSITRGALGDLQDREPDSDKARCTQYFARCGIIYNKRWTQNEGGGSRPTILRYKVLELILPLAALEVWRIDSGENHILK